MYTETGLLFPYYNTFPQEIQQFQDFPCIFRPSVSTESTVPDYDHGLEGDLFKAPEQIIEEDEEPLINLDPTASMISFGGELIESHEQDTESSIDLGQILSEVFYECKKDILAKQETGVKPLLSVEAEAAFDPIKDENNTFSQGIILRKSVSTGGISSMEKLPLEVSEPRNLLDYHVMDNGMRRAFSEGDLEILGNGTSSINSISAAEQQQIIINCSSEDRMEKILRYRNKKAKRNFGRKIKEGSSRQSAKDTRPIRKDRKLMVPNKHLLPKINGSFE